MSFFTFRCASILACASTLILSGSVHAQLLGALSEGEEAEVGRRAADEIEKGLVFLSDDLVTSYISELGQAMAAESQRSSLAYTFKVVDSEEINAFALPGGYIYVNRGLIEAADEEAELAGVMGHEIGHVVARHGAEQVQRAAYANLGLRLLGSLFGKGTGAQIGNVAAEMATTSVFMKFGRDAERDADRLGAENVAAAGHDPNGMITFFEKLGRLRDGQANAVERFFASHPDPTERVANIQDLVQSLRSSHEYSPPSPQFAQVKTHIEALPPPPSIAPDDPAKATSYDGSPTGGTPATVIPVPVTYEGADQDYQIAARFAPVFRQALGSSPRYDYITAFDFDGDWQGDNNWENAADDRYAMSATVYFNVSETLTHYYIHYAAFHPRDYKGGNVSGVVLSEVLREAAARHGDLRPDRPVSGRRAGSRKRYAGCAGCRREGCRPVWEHTR